MSLDAFQELEETKKKFWANHLERRRQLNKAMKELERISDTNSDNSEKLSQMNKVLDNLLKN